MIRLLFIALLIFPLTSCQEKEQSALKKNELVIESLDGAKHKFNIELAITLEEQARGLMHRTEMPEGAGMLFYFGEEAERSFWMKNTLIPLDMLFIKADGTIHRIHERAIPQNLTRVLSQGPVAAVLEINGGLSEKLGIQEGDKVQHAFFKEGMAQ